MEIKENDNIRKALLHTAFLLSLVTIFYNLVEGSVSLLFGMQDDTLALLGFGIVSFVEVISGLGIAHMVWRMKQAPVAGRDRFERRALRITGSAFFLLFFGLTAGAIIDFIQAQSPQTTLVGIIVSSVSIATMYFLMSAKLKVGRRLTSDAIIADAHCTRTCLYLSIILLSSSLLYELFHIGFFDGLGAIGIALFAFKEGREAFEKAASNKLSCSCQE